MTKELMELCYNVPGAPIYGQFVKGSLSKWVPHMKSAGNTDVHILDIGSGSGATMCTLASLFAPHATQLSGIELCAQRATLSRLIIPKLLPPNVTKWSVIECDVMALRTLPTGVTHSVSFDKTFPTHVMGHIEYLQHSCPSLVCVISCHKKQYTDRWQCIAKIPSTQHGSNSVTMAYVYIPKMRKK
jgi:hypothetical protein